MEEAKINVGSEDNSSAKPLIKAHFGNLFHQQIAPVRYAVIVETTHRTAEFRSTRGFYNKQINDLKRAGYIVITVNMENPLSQLENLPPSSIKFLWFRMHGAPQEMGATKHLTLTPANLGEIFKFLPPKLTDDAICFLESCSTGSLENLNNMQFAFAKLTLDKPQVQIVAPSKNNHICSFFIVDNIFNFEMLDAPYSTKAITVILGGETKKILQDAMQFNIALETIEDQLKNSLQINMDCTFFNTFRKKFGTSLIISGFELNSLIVQLILSQDLSSEILPLIKELIEVHEIDPNIDSSDGVTAFSHATPLTAAIFYGRGSVVEYLLVKGADPFYSFEGTTILGFAKEVDAGNVSGAYTRKPILKLRRQEENDQSKMVDIIERHLTNMGSLPLPQSPPNLQKSPVF